MFAMASACEIRSFLGVGRGMRFARPSGSIPAGSSTGVLGTATRTPTTGALPAERDRTPPKGTARSWIDATGLRRGIVAGVPGQFTLHLRAATPQTSGTVERLSDSAQVQSQAQSSAHPASGERVVSSDPPPLQLQLRLKVTRLKTAPVDGSVSARERSRGLDAGTKSLPSHRQKHANELERFARAPPLVTEERTYDVACSAEREQSCVLELSPLVQAGQYSLTLTLHELGAPRSCQSALAQAVCPCGHPQLQKPARWLSGYSTGPKMRALAAWMPKRGCGEALVPVRNCRSPPRLTCIPGAEPDQPDRRGRVSPLDHRAARRRRSLLL